VKSQRLKSHDANAEFSDFTEPKHGRPSKEPWMPS
jgi:hypothetical protein